MDEQETERTATTTQPPRRRAPTWDERAPMRRNRRQRRPSVEVYQRAEEFHRVAMQDYYTIRQLQANIKAQFQQEPHMPAMP